MTAYICHHLVTGGARAGKSTFALRQAEILRGDGTVGFIATAHPSDDDMAARIARHRAERGAHVHTVEEPLAVTEALASSAALHPVLILDCLTVWTANRMFTDDRPNDDALNRVFDELADAVRACPAHVLVVTNEVGLGIHPEHAVSRRYVDLLGRLNQRVAAACDRVTLLVAGVPLLVKG